jgi:hypothetical protein
MSELSEAFNKANLVFTHGNDFIVSLFEGAYMIAEDISDKMAEERKLYQAPIMEQIEIENEISGAVAFFGKLLPAFLILQISLLEDSLVEICETAAQQRNIPFDVGQSDHFTIQDAKLFLEGKLAIHFPNPWTAWEKVQELQRLRDHLVNHTGLQSGQVDISDSFLVDVNKRIILFLEELKKYVPDTTV